MSARPVPLGGSSVAGPTVTNNGTREVFTLHVLLLPPSESGSGSTSCTLFNSRSSSSSYLQRQRRTGLGIKQCTCTPEPDLDGGNISNVNSSLVPLFVTIGPPTDEPRSRMGQALIEGSYGERRTKGALPVISLFYAK